MGLVGEPHEALAPEDVGPQVVVEGLVLGRRPRDQRAHERQKTLHVKGAPPLVNPRADAEPRARRRLIPLPVTVIVMMVLMVVLMIVIVMVVVLMIMMVVVVAVVTGFVTHMVMVMVVVVVVLMVVVGSLCRGDRALELALQRDLGHQSELLVVPAEEVRLEIDLAVRGHEDLRHGVEGVSHLL